METKKQEVIRKAWGELFDAVQDYLDTEGYADFESLDMQQVFWDKDGDYFFQTTDRIGYNGECIGIKSFRPKSLTGIETNNGWIAIEREEDLPKDSYNYWIMCSNGSIKNLNDFEYYKKYIIPELAITHYQPIIKPLPPIY